MKAYPVFNEYNKVVKNQFIFEHNGYRYFQSYDDVIAKVDQNNGAIFLDKRKYYNSKTITVKFRNLFLDLSSSKIRSKINDCSIKFTDLNGEFND